MNCKINKLTKILIVAFLVLVVAGMAVLGFVGLNNTTDYSKGYEVQVSVDNIRDGEQAIAETSAKEYFKQVGLKNYTVQSMDDGINAVIIFKFNEDVTFKVSGLEEFVQQSLGADAIAIAEVDVVETLASNSPNIWSFVLGIAIAVVAIFVYTIIIEKLAGSVATLISSVGAGLLSVALIALTRVPANPLFLISIALSMLIASGIAITLVNRYRAEMKNEGSAKLSNAEIAQAVTKGEYKKFAILGGALVVFALMFAVLGLIGVAHMFNVCIHLLIVGVSAFIPSIVAAPVFWPLLAKKK